VQEIAGIPKIANQNSNFLTLQKSKFQKKNQTGIFGSVNGIRIPPPMGVLEIGTKNPNSKPSWGCHPANIGLGHKIVKFMEVANHSRTMMVLLRGSNDLVLAKANHLIHDAQCVVRLLVKERHLIAGGGTAKMEASLCLQELMVETTGMDLHCFCAYVDSLEVIPYTLAKNAGLKPIKIVMELRKVHATGNVRAGSDVKDECISDMYAKNVIQPLLVTTSAIKLATETVCMILKVRPGFVFLYHHKW
jgi:hypothetical protein